MERPTSMSGVLQALKNFSTPEARTAGLEYVARPSDVFIATYPKCGTTWMQQMFHCLRTGGDMDFGEITEVVPWLELCLDLGSHPNAKQRAFPRGFKSHFPYDELPSTGKRIHITRNPSAVLLSFYNFFQGWYFEPGSIGIEEFADELFLKGSKSGKYWDHVVQWWERRHDANVLFLVYEDAVAMDQDVLVRDVARFCGIEADERLVRLTVEHSSHQFMRTHAHKFNTNLVRRYRDGPQGLPPCAEGLVASKVGFNPACAAPAGHRRVKSLPRSVVKKLDEKWRLEVEARIGIASYEALCKVHRAEKKESEK